MEPHRRTLIGTMLVLLLAATACGRIRPGNTGTIEHPEGSEDVILRVEDGGFFGPLAWTFGALPSFSLYGDGRVIVPAPRIEIYPPPALQGLTVREVSEEGIQAILAEARDAGLLDGDRRYEGEGLDLDATTTRFTVNADGGRHVVSVYALGDDPEEAPSGERDVRRALMDFTSRLSSLEEWLPAGSVGPEELFAPDRLAVFTNPYDSEQGEFLPPLNEDEPDPPPEALPELDWPLEQPITGFGEPVEQYQGPPILLVRCGVVEGRDLEAILSTAEEASELTPWVSGGERYALVLRPLLPGEQACPES
ncbi:MAG: hypothetical protein ACRDI0_04125 [Actinomycetota bacterium]